MVDLVELFCSVDDFWKEFEPLWKQILLKKKNAHRTPAISISEIITIIVLFHLSGFRNFKHFYLGYLSLYLRSYFPQLPSYSRFIELKERAAFPLYAFLTTIFGTSNGVNFIDSSPIRVCHMNRSSSHKVFKGIAKKGRSSIGWFFGFKIHLIINDRGEILSFVMTPGNVDDRAPVSQLVRNNVFGKLFGDRGFISAELFKKLLDKGIELITRLRSNMKNQLISLYDKLMLRKRCLIESVIDQLKNISQIEHSRHRSVKNFVVNLLGGLVAYSLREKKPSIQMERMPMKFLNSTLI